MKIMFWNINQKNNYEIIKQCAYENKIDIIVLSEIKNLDCLKLESELKAFDNRFIHDEIIGSKRIKIFHRLENRLNIIREESHYSLFTVKISEFEISFIAVHLESLMGGTTQLTLDANMYEYRSDFEKIEENIGHENTVIFGDFNINPFSNGMVGTKNLNAVMCPNIAKRITREIKRKKYKFFYNPSWNLMAKHGNSTCGTYYYNGDAYTYYWNVFDQVIMRPSLIPYFEMKEYKVIDNVNGESLITKNGLPQNDISDHLPIIFTIREDGFNV